MIIIIASLNLRDFSETTDRGTGGSGSGGPIIKKEDRSVTVECIVSHPEP